jgi:hypothetical protein
MAILEHTLGIMLHPDREWKAIRSEGYSSLQVFMSHIPILALIPTLATYDRVTRLGWTIGNGEPVMLTSASAMTLCAAFYISLLIGVYVLGEFVNWMAKTYGVKDDADKRHYEGTALAVFVSTPSFLAGIFMLYPDLWVYAVALVVSLGYGVYLVYEGIPILMNISKEQAFMYATSVVTAGLVIAVTVRIASVIVWGMGVGPVYVN